MKTSPTERAREEACIAAVAAATLASAAACSVAVPLIGRRKSLENA